VFGATANLFVHSAFLFQESQGLQRHLRLIFKAMQAVLR
jgi:hypothetical protein